MTDYHQGDDAKQPDLATPGPFQTVVQQVDRHPIVFGGAAVGVLALLTIITTVSRGSSHASAPAVEPRAVVAIGSPCPGANRYGTASDSTQLRCRITSGGLRWQAEPTPAALDTAEPPVAMTPANVAPPSPTPAWAPCDPSLSSYDPGGCDDDFSSDTCDAAYVSSRDGSLLDAFIENKLFVDEKRLKDCPQFLPTWRKAQTGMDEGTFEVGTEVKPGTYETTAHLTGGRVTDCYWERSGSNGNIIANNFVTAAKKVRVTIRTTDEMFTSRGCGDWVRV